MTGTLEIAGETRPITVELSVDPEGGIGGSAALTQSEWWIEPCAALMGALKVRDALEVVCVAGLAAR